jgi:Mce-associated membrane protein
LSIDSIASEEERVVPAKPARSLTIAIRMPGRSGLVKALAVLLLAAAVGVGAWQWHRAEGLTATEATRRQISTVAGQFGRALLSYDHDHLDQARKQVTDLATTDFGRTYDVAFTGGLQDAITKLKADATADIRTVYLTGGTHGTAQAVVVMDSQVKSTAGTRDVTGSYLQMDLVKQGGRWKVSAVNSIGAINETLNPGASSTPAPTPKPSP